jgi:hypothetical protein
LIKFLAQTRLESVAVPANPAANALAPAAATAHQTSIHEALIHATVRACHHRGILSNLLPNLNNRFSRSLLFVWYAHLPFVKRSNLICKF